MRANSFEDVWDRIEVCESNECWLMPGIRTLFKAREHSKDWQWPVRWHGTLSLTSERPNEKE